jgi:hypothetical protein
MKTGGGNMSWIRRDKKEQEIKKVFLEIIRLSKKIKAQKNELFPIKSDSDAESYYICRQKRSLNPKDFETIDCRSFDDLQDRLHEYWAVHGDDDLISLAPSMKRLAETLYDVHDQDEEISPYIYVMF